MGTELCQAEEASLKNGIFYVFIKPFLLRSLWSLLYRSTASWIVYTEQQCASEFPWAQGATVTALAIFG